MAFKPRTFPSFILSKELRVSQWTSQVITVVSNSFAFIESVMASIWIAKLHKVIRMFTSRIRKQWTGGDFLVVVRPPGTHWTRDPTLSKNLRWHLLYLSVLLQEQELDIDSLSCKMLFLSRNLTLVPLRSQGSDWMRPRTSQDYSPVLDPAQNLELDCMERS